MRSRVLIIALAAVLALAGVVAILAYVRGANERAVAGLKAETVMAASSPIPAGVSLAQASREHLLHSEDVPVSSLAGAGPPVRTVTGVYGQMVVSSAMTRGEVLLQSMLAPAGSTVAGGGGLAVPPKMFAVSVDVCVPEDVAGYVTPGTDVAVFDVLVPDAAASAMTPSCGPDHPVLGRDVITNPGQISSILVLASVQVLSVAQNPGGQAATGTAAGAPEAPSPGSEVLVTFAATQQQAGQLMVLQQGGIPYLALIGPGAAASPAAGPAGL